VMPGDIAAETGRLSASVPTPRRSSSRLGSGLLITTVVVQAYKEAGQTDRRAGMHAGGPNRAEARFWLVSHKGASYTVTQLLWNANRKSYTLYRIALFPLTVSDS